MKSSNTKALTTRLLFALALAAVNVAGLSGLAEAATCYTCHAPVGSTTDLRPVESSPFRNITTGSIKGSHLKHIPVATMLVSDCAACHGGAGGVTAYTTKHRNGILDVPIVGYSKAGFAQTGNSVPLGTCSTASCHVTSHGTTYVPTPTWGVTSGCVGCHTGAGAFTGTGQSPNTGSHTKHLAASATCGNCHAGAVASSSGGNAHVDGNIDVSVYTVTNVVKHTAGSGYTTCSNSGTAACHVSPFGTGTIVTTVWGTADCAACHVNSGASAPTTGSHTKHQATGAVCGSCHANATAGVTGGSAHRDGNIDVTNVGYTANVTKHTAGSGYKTCSSASCHASPYGTVSSPTPTWGTGGAGGCISCHNGAGAFTASGGPATGSHTKHFSQSATCGQCHDGVIASSNGGTAHGDTNIDVTGSSVSGYTANVTKHSSASGYTGSCSTTCHTSPYTTAAGTTPTWGVAGGCGSCHNGVGAFVSGGPVTGSHSKHQASICANCHAGASAGYSGGTAHRDTNIDVTGLLVGSSYTANVTKHAAISGYTGTCLTTCHGNPYNTTAGSTPTWGAAGSGCAACHNGSGAFTGTGSAPSSGSHTKHMTVTVNSVLTTCATCHAGADPATTGGIYHGDNNIDITGYITPNITKHAFGSGYKTCTTANCHVNPFGTASIPSPTWGQSTACGECHTGAGSFSGAGSSPTTGSHTKHQSRGAVCSQCHSGASAAISGGTAHIDSNIDVTSVGYSNTSNVTKHAVGSGYGTCNNASCHSSPYTTVPATTPSWGSSGVGGCVSCHIGTGAFTAGGGPATGSHTKHQATVTCGQCHAGASAGISGGTVHGDTNIDVTGTSVSGYTPNVTKHTANTGYVGTCSTSCHENPYTTAAGSSPTWGFPGSGGCGSCHNGVGAFIAGGPVTGSHSKHQASICANCHAGASAGFSGGTAHGDANIDVTGLLVGSSYTANVTKHAAISGYTGTCLTTCHGNPYNTTAGSTPTWGAAGSGCAACHNGSGAFTGTGSAPSSGSHSKHMTVTVNSVLTTCATCHAGADPATTGGIYHGDNNIDITGYITPNITKHAFGSGYKTCTTANCHVSPFSTASIPSPTWGQSTACGECHTGAGSFSGAGSSPTTGSHTKHQASGTSGRCTNCHAGATAGISGGIAHLDGNIDITVGYTAPNVTKHTTGTGYSTCSNVSCHSNPFGTDLLVTPAWGSSSPACSACHVGSGAFSGAGASPTTGSHSKHQAGGSRCANCHAGATAGVTGGSAHNDSNIDVIASVGYTANVTKHPAGSGYFTCSNATPCHSNPFGTDTPVTPTWGIVSAPCVACHNGPGAFTGAETSPTTGGHTKHQAAGFGACANCHASATAGVTGGSAHSDGNIDVIAGYTANVTKHTSGTGYTSCNAASCHANPFGTNMPQTGIWGSSSGACAACHNGTGAFTGTGSSPTTGSHSKHRAGGATCANCHTGATAGITGGPVGIHMDTNIDVIEGYPPNVIKHTGTTAGYYKRCLGASCHANPFGTTQAYTPTWGAVSAACAACHNGAGLFSGAGSSPTTGSHTKHQAAGGTNGQCFKCHAGATAGITGGTAHFDGNIDVIAGYAFNGTTVIDKHTNGSGYGTCNDASCHANPFGTNKPVTPTWGIVAGACIACHNGVGTFTGGGTSPTTGSHSKHQAGGSTCANCHTGTIAGVTGGPVGTHIDGNIDVLASVGYTANVTKHTAGSGYSTCSNATPCHSNPFGSQTPVTPAWGEVSAPCVACHNGPGAFSGAGTSPTTGGHTIHQASGYGACASCHATASAGVTGGSAHLDGNIDVIGGYTANVTKHTLGSGYSRCTAASCHANPFGTIVPQTGTWGTYTAACVACHNGTGAFTGTGSSPTTGSHSKHRAGGSTCANCHTGVVAGITGGTPATHMDTNIDVIEGYPSDRTKHTGTIGYQRCLGASCHANPFGTAPTYTPTWGVSQAACAACHNGVGAFSGTGSSPTTGSHTKHQAAGGTNGQCFKCHAGATAGITGGTAHFDGNIDVIAGYAPDVSKHTSGSGYGRCSAASCHADPYSTSMPTTPTWGVVQATCGACHNGVGAFTAIGAGSANKAPNTGSHAAGSHSLTACVICHTGASAGVSGGTAHLDGNIDVTAGYRANVTKHAVGTYPAGITGSCGGGTGGYSNAACHSASGAPQWGNPASNLGMTCLGCHATSKIRTMGRPGATLSAVGVGVEFGLAYGHKKSTRGAVTDADCIVCHLEGVFSTQQADNYNSSTNPTGTHKNGNIDLRDPDGSGEGAAGAIKNIIGGAFTFQRFSTSYAAGSRTSTGHTSNTDIANVITQKFCLACHDSNGATNTSARSGAGTAAMPFGGIALGTTYTTANGAMALNGLINVKAQTATTNSSFHPVQGPKFKGYPTTALMIAPYNNFTRTAGTKSNGVVMNCFDCHNVATTPLTTRTTPSHGNAALLRGTVYVASATLCTKCHAATYESSTNMHPTGSAWTNSSGRNHISDTGLICYHCHGSNSTVPARPIKAADYHGYNKLLNNANWPTINTRPYAFIRNTVNLANHKPKTQPDSASTTATCMIAASPNGACSGYTSDMTNIIYTPGGVY